MSGVRIGDCYLRDQEKDSTLLDNLGQSERQEQWIHIGYRLTQVTVIIKGSGIVIDIGSVE